MIQETKNIHALFLDRGLRVSELSQRLFLTLVIHFAYQICVLVEIRELKSNIATPSVTFK
jgi:hypothetical protein